MKEKTRVQKYKDYWLKDRPHEATTEFEDFLFSAIEKASDEDLRLLSKAYPLLVQAWCEFTGKQIFSKKSSDWQLLGGLS